MERTARFRGNPVRWALSQCGDYWRSVAGNSGRLLGVTWAPRVALRGYQLPVAR